MRGRSSAKKEVQGGGFPKQSGRRRFPDFSPTLVRFRLRSYNRDQAQEIGWGSVFRVFWLTLRDWLARWNDFCEGLSS